MCYAREHRFVKTYCIRMKSASQSLSRPSCQYWLVMYSRSHHRFFWQACVPGTGERCGDAADALKRYRGSVRAARERPGGARLETSCRYARHGPRQGYDISQQAQAACLPGPPRVYVDGTPHLALGWAA